MSNDPHHPHSAFPEDALPEDASREDPRNGGLGSDADRSSPSGAADGLLSTDVFWARELAAEGLGSEELLQRLLAAERVAFEEELCPVADAEAARGMAHRIVTEARRDEGARRRAFAARPQGRARRRLAYLLAGSLALHVLVLGFLAFRGESRPPVAPSGEYVAWDYSDAPLSDDTELPESEASLAELLRAAGLRPQQIDERLDRLAVEDGPVALLQDADEPAPRPVDPLEALLGPAERARLIQGDEALKVRRLRRFDRDPARTLATIRRGLAFLASRQFADGRFEAAEGTPSVEVTGRAVLAFLGDGYRSARVRTERHDDVVRRSVAWLREHMFDLRGLPQRDVPRRSLGVGLAALSEDFVLSRSDLPLAETQARAREIVALADHLREAGQTGPRDSELWQMWALDAAARTGLVMGRAEDGERFEQWVAQALPTGVGDPTRSVDPARAAFAALSEGTALLYAERGARRQRFKDWRSATVGDLLGALLPNGKAKEGDPVAQTTLLVLALQTGYRPL